MLYRVFYSKRAEAQLASIFRYIAGKSSQRIASRYISALREHCDRLDRFPIRGRDLSGVGAGLRSLGFRHTATIVFRVSEDSVTVVAVFYRGRNVQARL